MVDMHHHIIFGVDDGAKDFDMSIAMVKKAIENNVHIIVCTSHCTPGHHRFKWEAYTDHFNQIQAYIDENHLEMTLVPGCEVLYTEDTPMLAKEGAFPLMGASRSMLVEFLPQTEWSTIKKAARDIGNAGFQMVAAHVERYMCLTDDISLLEELHDDYGVICQMNASTVIKSSGFFGDRWAKNALKNELIDVVGSDSHNVTSRACNLKEARDVLIKSYGKDKAKELLVDEPLRILNYGVDPA